MFDSKVLEAGRKGTPLSLSGLVVDFALIGTEYYNLLVQHDPTIQTDSEKDYLPPIITRTGRRGNSAFERLYIVKPGYIERKRQLLEEDNPAIVRMMAIMQTTFEHNNPKHGEENSVHLPIRAIMTKSLKEESTAEIEASEPTKVQKVLPKKLKVKKNTRSNVSYALSNEELTYLHQISQYPLLTAKRGKELAQIIQLGRKPEADRKAQDLARTATEEFELANPRLVFSIAKAYMEDLHSFTIMDLFHEGYFGLKTAVQKYDPEIGRFSTYAVFLIKKSISVALFERGYQIKEPVNESDILNKARKIANQIEESGATVTPEAIAKIMGISVVKAKSILLSTQQRKITSIDQPFYEEY